MIATGSWFFPKPGRVRFFFLQVLGGSCLFFYFLMGQGGFFSPYFLFKVSVFFYLFSVVAEENLKNL